MQTTLYSRAVMISGYSGSEKLQKYAKAIQAIRRGDSTHGKSYAKPLLILAIMDCIGSKVLSGNKIMWYDKNLMASYEKLGKELGVSNKTKLVVPYFFLSSSSFYKLVWRSPDKALTHATSASMSYLRENLLYAQLDDELWDLLQDSENRRYLKEVILKTFIP